MFEHCQHRNGGEWLHSWHVAWKFARDETVTFAFNVLPKRRVYAQTSRSENVNLAEQSPIRAANVQNAPLVWKEGTGFRNALPLKDLVEKSHLLLF